MRRRELIWRNLWLAMRRAPRDKRALQYLLSWFGFSTYLLYLAGFARFYGFGGIVMMLGILALATGTAVVIARSNARTGETLLRLSAKPATAQEDLREHRKKIVATLLGTAALCDRAAVEAMAREGKIHEQSRGLGRQRTLSLARLEMVWSQLGKDERDLLIADEGSWTWEQTSQRITQVEDVRVMRWVIGMDRVLRPFEFLKPDLSPVFRTTTHAEEANGDFCLAAYDLRPAQTMAHAMVERCVAEGVHRGFYKEDDPELHSMYVEMAKRMEVLEDDDLLIGAATVAHADQEQIQWIGLAAFRRVRILEGLIAYLNGPADAELRTGYE